MGYRPDDMRHLDLSAVEVDAGVTDQGLGSQTLYLHSLPVERTRPRVHFHHGAQRAHLVWVSLNLAS